ncbi:MAG: hypothetical protein V4584_11890 [Verrucomicrobiota bacterium]
MASDHPFQLLFETLGRVPASHAESVNRQAYEILSDILSVPVEKTGRCILLRAPRAGHGKTHLLSRIQHQLGASCEFVPLHAAFGCRIDAASVTDDTLRRLVRQLPASGGLTVLDLMTRRLFASALQPLVGSGEVPCQDREGALTALRNRPIETFDFHHPNAVTAHWARENFEVLGQRLAQELSQRSGLPVGGISFWVDVLFRFASAPLENSNRVRILADEVHAAVGMEMERLEALLGLLTLLMRVVLVADDLEGFSADETAALRLAAFLGSLRQSVERLDVVLSLNQDIWQSAFVPRLSGGLADRLSEVVVELEPLTEAEMAALLDSRVPGLGRRVLDRIDVGSAGTHARGLIRAAGMAWLKATATDSAATPAVNTAFTAPPAAEAPIPPASPPPLPEAVAAIEPTAPTPVVEPEPIFATAPVFTFSPEASSPVEVPAPAWPAPEFDPAPPVEVTTEPSAYQPPVDSPFKMASPEPVASFAPTQWQEEPVISPSWTPSAAAAETVPAPSCEAGPLDSPFQLADVQEFKPEVQMSSVVPDRDPPALESPFQVAQESFAPSFSAPEWQPNPQPASQPAADSPFHVAETQEFSRNPDPSSFSMQEWQPNPAFEPKTAVETPFQPASPQPFTPNPPAASFAPPQWQETQPVAFQPPVDSPFQAAGSFTPQPPQTAFAPQEWQPAPATEFQPPVDSPFQIAAQEIPPASEPVSSAPAQSADDGPAPTAADTDRVDDLLRQFRERYGRGSL